MKRFDFELVGLMKYHIEEYYDDKLENDVLLKNNLTNHDIKNHYDEYFKSDYLKKSKNYKSDNVRLIYKGKISDKMEAEKYSEDDFKEDNNIIMVIVETDKINYYDLFNLYIYFLIINKIY